jgi:two-component system, response regulator, stage 0 sporulation protein F
MNYHGRKKSERKILIVEDDNKVLDFLHRLLSNKGYATVRANRGSRGLRLASIEKPDMVVLDLGLPDCSGIDVLKQLKAMDEAIQVIILTGYGSQKAARDAMELGAFDFLTKPFEVSELCAVIQKAISLKPPAVVKERHHAR